jgi:5-methyltetrahydropteroyltriglutamate--homocysteine methyltransferase
VNLPKHLLPTTVVGSYPQPDWLVDRALLSKSVPRTRMHEMWRVAEEHLEQAQDDATIVAIRDMERAGIDIVTDGEIRRESYSNRFATALEGVDADNPAIIVTRSGQQTPVPRVVGKIRRTRPVELRDMQFLRKNTDRPAKITLPGPFTMSQQARDEFYGDDDELAMAFAEAVNAEALDLEKAGADVIQLDEPWVRNNPELARRYAVKAINRALRGITVPTVVHLCFGYAAVVPGSTKPAGYSFLSELADTSADQISIEAAQPKLDLGVLKDLSGKKIMLGVLDLGDPSIESVDTIADRIRNGLKYVAAERLFARARLRHEIHATAGCVRKAEGDGRSRPTRARRAWLTNERCRAFQGRSSGWVFGAGACSISAWSGSLSPWTASDRPIQSGSAR